MKTGQLGSESLAVLGAAPPSLDVRVVATSITGATARPGLCVVTFQASTTGACAARVRLLVFSGDPKIGWAALAQAGESATIEADHGITLLYDGLGLQSGLVHTVDLSGIGNISGVLVTWPYDPNLGALVDGIVSLMLYPAQGASSAGSDMASYAGHTLRPSGGSSVRP